MKKIVILLFINLFLVISFISDIYAQISSLRKISFDAGGFRDPFKSVLPEKKIEDSIPKIQKPETEIEVETPEINIQGIVWGGQFPQAIINGKVMKEGDVLSGQDPITILEIKPKEVVILYKSKIFNFATK